MGWTVRCGSLISDGPTNVEPSQLSQCHLTAIPHKAGTHPADHELNVNLEYARFQDTDDEESCLHG